MAVRASSSIPGLVQPTLIEGREYIDGGLVSEVPVRVARKLGADVVVAVDISRNLSPENQLKSTFSVFRQAIAIMSHKISEGEMSEADILIKPNVGDIAANEFELRNKAVAAGEASALEKVDEIRRVIAEKSSRLRDIK